MLTVQITGHWSLVSVSQVLALLTDSPGPARPRPVTSPGPPPVLPSASPGRAGAKYDTKFVLVAAKVAPIPDILPSRGNKTLTFNKNSAGPAIIAN